MFETNNKKQKGVSLYLALMVMTIMLAISLGLSSIFIGQTKMVKQMGNSVIALGAADTGIEAVLINRNSPTSIPETVLSNGASYQVVVATGGSSDCPAERNFCIKSIGSYLGTKRAVEIVY